MKHDFSAAPNRTLVGLTIPILFSLVAEPLTGLVDTAFVARLGAAPLAALGVGTITLSSIFWVFNFLSVGTQTEVAQASGRGLTERAAELAGMALAMSAGLGVVVALAGWPASGLAADALGATEAVRDDAVAYIRWRLVGGPAVLLMLASFGTMRGLQEMRLPLWIALAVNALNIVLDAVLIFGMGPVPAMGIAGAAIASSVSQWVGAGLALWLLYRRLGLPAGLKRADASRLLVIGGDLFVRTGMLTLFLLLTTREATRMGAAAGAAHQAIRQVWMFAALALDAFAIAGQSLVGYFIGAENRAAARRVAGYVCLWSLGTGVVLFVSMVAGEPLAVRLLVPPEAVAVFSSAWFVAAVFQPLNALTFATDGLHWGTGDFRYLRNAVITATLTGALCVWLLVDVAQPGSLTLLWVATGVWIVVRAVFGLVRIWPGVGASPYRVGGSRFEDQSLRSSPSLEP
ncbi:MAG: MATE family efflux transporter [Rhodothermales bacterium]